MLTVTSLSGETELLTNIKNCEVNEEVNGDFSISFTSFLSDKNAHSYPLLEDESIVDLDGHEFRVKNLVEVRNQKQVKAQHIFFDLIEHQLYGYIGGTKSADDIFYFILAGSGWTFENVDVTNYIVLSNFGENNAVKLIRDACNALDCEIKIMPGKHIKLYKRIGTDTDNQFRFSHNIKTLRKNVDTTNLFTVIKGFGANGLEVTYTSPNASIYGERHAEPIRDDRYSLTDSLIDRLKQELNDAPEISYDIELSQLYFDVHLGDQFWTIYEPLDMDIKTRISTFKWYPFSKKSPVITVENRKKTFSDILTRQKVEINENKKEYRSRFDQTNESIATVDLKADNIVLSVEAVEQSIAAVDIKADNITLSVSDLSGRVDSAESSISIQAGLISSKVEKNGIKSAINQSSETIEIEAENINMYGITMVNDRLNIGEPGTFAEKVLVFNNNSAITAYDSLSMELDSFGHIYFAGDVRFRPYYGGSNIDVDFTGANVIGLSVSSANYANSAGYASSAGSATYADYVGVQDLTITVNGIGTLQVTTSSGKTATYTADYWSG